MHEPAALLTVSDCRYQSLSVAGSGSEEQVTNPGSKRISVSVAMFSAMCSYEPDYVQPDWSVNLGEGVIQVQVVTLAAGPSRLLVLGMLARIRYVPI